jgi:hypothetical protein
MRTMELMRGGRWLRGVQTVALVLTVLALVRFYADTLEIFLVRLEVASIAWALYAVLVHDQPAEVLRYRQGRAHHPDGVRIGRSESSRQGREQDV